MDADDEDIFVLEAPKIAPWDQEDYEKGNTSAAIDYCDDIVQSYFDLETDPLFKVDYMTTVQTDIKPRMRTILYCWMVEVHSKFKLKEQSLWSAWSLCDRYLSRVDVHRQTLQLVGSCCLWLACKYHEIFPPLANDFVYIADRAFTRQQLFKCEAAICLATGYDIARPTPYTYAHRFIKAGMYSVTSTRHRERVKWLTLFALERAALMYEMIKYKPSILAASALYCSLALTGHKWSAALAELTSYKNDDLRPIARELRKIILTFEDPTHKVVITKYATKKRGAVSMLRRKTNSSTQAKAQPVKGF